LIVSALELSVVKFICSSDRLLHSLLAHNYFFVSVGNI
jgi:hypothetical protein